MINPEEFFDIHNRIIGDYQNGFPSTPERLFTAHDAKPDESSQFWNFLIFKGGNLVKTILDTGKSVSNSDLVKEVMAHDIVKHAAAGAAVGAGITMMIPFSLVGLPTGAAVGASVATWKYFTRK